MVGIRKILILLFKPILVFFITIILLEAGFRLYNKINPVFVFPSSSSYDRFRGKPFAEDYSFRLNSKGFKDLEYKKEKDQKTFRIIGIGDSFAYGVVPYKYNFLTVLEEKLNQAGRPFEVINMGIPGIGVEDYFAVLVNEALELKPDLVICLFFIGNDFLDEVRQGKSSYLISFLRYVFKILPKYEGKVIHGKASYDDDKPSFEFSKFLEIEKARSYIYKKDNKEFLKHVDNAVSYIKKMTEICAYENIKFLVVIIPDEIQVNPILQLTLVKHFNWNSEEFDFTRPNKLLHSKLERFDIEYLELLNDFVRLSKDKRLYKPNDTHWNIDGNEFAAKLIFDTVKNTAGSITTKPAKVSIRNLSGKANTESTGENL